MMSFGGPGSGPQKGGGGKESSDKDIMKRLNKHLKKSGFKPMKAPKSGSKHYKYRGPVNPNPKDDN